MSENKPFLDDLDDELSQNTNSRFKAQQASLFDPVQPYIDPIVEVWAQPVALPPYPRENEVWSHPIGEEPRYATYNPNSRMNRVDPDLIGEAAPRPIMGADILAIRELTGKKRENAMKALHNAAVEMLKQADAACYYIQGNVASSKNNKEIGRFKKRNKATGKLEDFNTLVDSKITQAYRKATAGYWLQNKLAFLNETRHLPLPLEIEFTFIRESLRRSDFVNMAQVLCDLMVEYGWLPDDDSVHLVPRFNPVSYYSKELAGVLIRVIH